VPALEDAPDDLNPDVVVVPEEAQEDVEKVTTPDAALADLKKDTESITDPVSSSDLALLPVESDEDTNAELVPIDKLPQTGTPTLFFLYIALTLGAALSYRKKTSL